MLARKRSLQLRALPPAAIRCARRANYYHKRIRRRLEPFSYSLDTVIEFDKMDAQSGVERPKLAANCHDDAA
jgi:hypothetical protein